MLFREEHSDNTTYEHSGDETMNDKLNYLLGGIVVGLVWIKLRTRPGIGSCNEYI